MGRSGSQSQKASLGTIRAVPRDRVQRAVFERPFNAVFVGGCIGHVRVKDYVAVIRDVHNRRTNVRQAEDAITSDPPVAEGSKILEIKQIHAASSPPRKKMPGNVRAIQDAILKRSGAAPSATLTRDDVKSGGSIGNIAAQKNASRVLSLESDVRPQNGDFSVDVPQIANQLESERPLRAGQDNQSDESEDAITSDPSVAEGSKTI